MLRVSERSGTEESPEKVSGQVITILNTATAFAFFIDCHCKPLRPGVSTNKDFDLAAFVGRINTDSILKYLRTLEDCELKEETLKTRLRAVQQFLHFCKTQIPIKKLVDDGAHLTVCADYCHTLKSKVQSRLGKHKMRNTPAQRRLKDVAAVLKSTNTEQYRKLMKEFEDLCQSGYFNEFPKNVDSDELIYSQAQAYKEFRKWHMFVVGSIFSQICLSNGQRPDVGYKMKTREYVVSTTCEYNKDGHLVLAVHEHNTGKIRPATVVLTDEPAKILDLYYKYLRPVIKPRVITVNNKSVDMGIYFLLNLSGNWYQGQQADLWTKWLKMVGVEEHFTLRDARTAIATLSQCRKLRRKKKGRRRLLIGEEEVKFLTMYLNHSAKTESAFYAKAVTEAPIKGRKLIDVVTEKASTFEDIVETVRWAGDGVEGDDDDDDDEEENSVQANATRKLVDDAGHSKTPQTGVDEDAGPSNTPQAGQSTARRVGLYNGSIAKDHGFRHQDYNNDHGLTWRAPKLQSNEVLKDYFIDRAQATTTKIKAVRDQLNRLIRNSFAEEVAVHNMSRDEDSLAAEHIRNEIVEIGGEMQAYFSSLAAGRKNEVLARIATLRESGICEEQVNQEGGEEEEEEEAEETEEGQEQDMLKEVEVHGAEEPGGDQPGEDQQAAAANQQQLLPIPKATPLQMIRYAKHQTGPQGWPGLEIKKILP